MAETVKKSTSKAWLRFFLAQNPPLSAAGKNRLERAITTLQLDGVDIDSLCRRLISFKKLPIEEPSTILSRFSSADQRRIKALPKNLRAIASVLKKDHFDSLVRWGMQRCPSLTETLNHLSLNDDGLFLMRSGSSRGDLFLKLPEILEDVAQAIENTMERPPQTATYAMRITYIVGQVEAESRSRREHYQEILTSSTLRGILHAHMTHLRT